MKTDTPELPLAFWVCASVFVVAFIVSIARGTWRREWNNEAGMDPNVISGYWPFGEALWRGWVRCGPLGAPFFLSAFASAVAFSLELIVLGLLLGGIFALTTVFTFTVIFLGRPKFVIAPHLRPQIGAFAEWLGAKPVPVPSPGESEPSAPLVRNPTRPQINAFEDQSGLGASDRESVKRWRAYRRGWNAPAGFIEDEWTELLGNALASERWAGDKWLWIGSVPTESLLVALDMFLGSEPWPAAKLEGNLQAVSRADAVTHLRTLIHQDLAYGGELVPEQEADDRAKQILDSIGTEASFWTNTKYPTTWPGPGASSWSPLTDATFDSGVLGMNGDRFLVVWFADED